MGRFKVHLVLKAGIHARCGLRDGGDASRQAKAHARSSSSDVSGCGSRGVHAAALFGSLLAASAVVPLHGQGSGPRLRAPNYGPGPPPGFRAARIPANIGRGAVAAAR